MAQISSRIGSFSTRARERINTFASNTKGNVAITAAISLIPIFGAVGAAVDYSRVSHTKSVVASSLDAALLASAADLSSGAIEEKDFYKRLNAVFQTNMDANGLKGLVANISSHTIDQKTGAVDATVTVDMPMVFAGLVGVNTVRTKTTAQAVYSDKKIEMSMMLDVTGSMGSGGKLKALKVAAADAVDILIADNAVNKAKVRIGLVPYSYSVNAGKYAKAATDFKSHKCVTERGGTHAFTDQSYRYDPVGADARAVKNNNCPSQIIRPLTSKKKDLIKDIKSFKASGYTAGHLGVAWSYYMLSPKWKQLWPSSGANSYGDKKTIKIALLMTDGEFNTYYDGTSGTAWGPHSAKSSSAANNLCKDMKKKGITVYSVAFQAPKSAQKTLKACATPDTANEQFYYNAKNAAQLQAAFQQIAINVRNLRLAR
ncbi:MAG: TadE/TadG family type IV pilus assembly protein [Pseudomonadota bacterium]